MYFSLNTTNAFYGYIGAPFKFTIIDAIFSFEISVVNMAMVRDVNGLKSVNYSKNFHKTGPDFCQGYLFKYLHFVSFNIKPCKIFELPLKEGNQLEEPILCLIPCTYVFKPELEQRTSDIFRQKSKLCTKKIALQRTQLSGMKLLFFINYRHLKIQKHSVSMGLSCTFFSLYDHFSRQFTYAVLLIFKTVGCI